MPIFKLSEKKDKSSKVVAGIRLTESDYVNPNTAKIDLKDVRREPTGVSSDDLGPQDEEAVETLEMPKVPPVEVVEDDADSMMEQTSVSLPPPMTPPPAEKPAGLSPISASPLAGSTATPTPPTDTAPPPLKPLDPSTLGASAPPPDEADSLKPETEKDIAEKIGSDAPASDEADDKPKAPMGMKKPPFGKKPMGKKPLGAFGKKPMGKKPLGAFGKKPMGKKPLGAFGKKPLSAIGKKPMPPGPKPPVAEDEVKPPMDEKFEAVIPEIKSYIKPPEQETAPALKPPAPPEEDKKSEVATAPSLTLPTPGEAAPLKPLTTGEITKDGKLKLPTPGAPAAPAAQDEGKSELKLPPVGTKPTFTPPPPGAPTLKPPAPPLGEADKSPETGGAKSPDTADSPAEAKHIPLVAPVTKDDEGPKKLKLTTAIDLQKKPNYDKEPETMVSLEKLEDEPLVTGSPTSESDAVTKPEEAKKEAPTLTPPPALKTPAPAAQETPKAPEVPTLKPPASEDKPAEAAAAQPEEVKLPETAAPVAQEPLKRPDILPKLETKHIDPKDIEIKAAPTAEDKPAESEDAKAETPTLKPPMPGTAPTLKPPTAGDAPTLKPPAAADKAEGEDAKAETPTLKPPMPGTAPTLKPPTAGDAPTLKPPPAADKAEGEEAKAETPTLKPPMPGTAPTLKPPTAGDAPTLKPPAAAADKAEGEEAKAETPTLKPPMPGTAPTLKPPTAGNAPTLKPPPAAADKAEGEEAKAEEGAPSEKSKTESDDKPKAPMGMKKKPMGAFGKKPMGKKPLGAFGKKPLSAIGKKPMGKKPLGAFGKKPLSAIGKKPISPGPKPGEEKAPDIPTLKPPVTEDKPATPETPTLGAPKKDEVPTLKPPTPRDPKPTAAPQEAQTMIMPAAGTPPMPEETTEGSDDLMAPTAVIPAYEKIDKANAPTSIRQIKTSTASLYCFYKIVGKWQRKHYLTTEHGVRIGGADSLNEITLNDNDLDKLQVVIIEVTDSKWVALDSGAKDMMRVDGAPARQINLTPNLPFVLQIGSEALVALLSDTGDTPELIPPEAPPAPGLPQFCKIKLGEKEFPVPVPTGLPKGENKEITSLGPANFCLTPINDPDKVLQVLNIPAGSPPQHVGRSSKLSELLVIDKNVSRKHAQLTPQSKTLVVEDCDTSNGTYVNSEEITGPTPVRAGEMVTFGNIPFMVSYK